MKDSLKSKIIVIDGLDGCGKQTQVKRIKEKLETKGYKVYTTSFPNYESLSSGPVRMYLNSELGDTPDSVNPYLASTFYAVDRAITFIKEVKEYYNNGYIILLDRYISANVIYQGSKFKDTNEMVEYFKWNYDLETNKLGLPVEDITIALTLPIETSQKLMSQRYGNDDNKKDLHERNRTFLESCSSTLDIACEYLPKIGINWVKLDCSNGLGWIQPIEYITNKLLTMIEPILS